MVVVKVLSQDRVQQRRTLLANAFLSGLWSRSSIFPEQTVEQIVDISPGDGLGLGSTSSAGAADEDFTGFFALFPRLKKCEAGSALESEGARQCQLIHAGGSARAGLWSHPASLRERGGLAIPLS